MASSMKGGSLDGSTGTRHLRANAPAPPRLCPGVARPPGSWQSAQFKPARRNHPKSLSDFPVTGAGKLVMRRDKRFWVRESRLLQQTTSGLQLVCNFCTVRRIKFERLVIQSMLHDMITGVGPEIIRQRLTCRRLDACEASTLTESSLSFTLSRPISRSINLSPNTNL